MRYDIVMAFTYAIMAAEHLKTVNKIKMQTITIEEAIRHPNFLSLSIEGGYEETSPCQMAAPRRTRLYKVRFKSDRQQVSGVYSSQFRTIFGCLVDFPDHYIFINADNSYFEPVLRTDDGVNLFMGNKYWHVNRDFKAFEAQILIPVFNRDYSVPIFSTKTAADKYIAENKPMYSAKQFIASCESEYKKGRADERRALMQPLSAEYVAMYSYRPKLRDNVGNECEYNEIVYTPLNGGGITCRTAVDCVRSFLPFYKYKSDVK